MIFVSYSWQDSATSEIVEAALKRLGLVYWIDRKFLNLSNCLQPQILRAIHQSHQVLCLKSKNSQLSPWVCYELEVALQMGKRVLELNANHECLKPNNARHADKLLASLLVFR